MDAVRRNRTQQAMEVSKAAKGLKRLREKAELSVQDVADALKKPKSTYASYEDKFKKPFLPLDLVKALVPVLTPRGVDRSDLLALAGVPDAFEPEQREAVSTGADERMQAVEELDVAASAGPGAIVDGAATVVRKWMVPRELVAIATDSPMDSIKILPLKGDSMEPTYRALDRVMVDTADTMPSPGGVFVVWDGLGLVAKRVQIIPGSDPLAVKITSDNPRYDPYERVLGEAHIQGRVIGKWLWT